MGRLMWIGGTFSVLAVILHASRHTQFGGDPSIQALSVDVRSVLYTLNACIAYVMVSFAYLSFVHWRELTSARLGRALAVAMGLFWFVRAAAVPLFAEVAPAFPVLPVLLFALPGLSYILPLVLVRAGAAQRGDGAHSAAQGGQPIPS